MAETRLNRIIRKYNIGLQSLVDFLRSKGVYVEENPNAKVSDEYLPLIAKRFAKDFVIKRDADQLDIRMKEIIERRLTCPPEADVEETRDAGATSGSIPKVPTIRMNKIQRRYNIGLQPLVDFLHGLGVDVEASPNAKVSEEYLPAIERQFVGEDVQEKNSHLDQDQEPDGSPERPSYSKPDNDAVLNEDAEMSKTSEDSLLAGLAATVSQDSDDWWNAPSVDAQEIDREDSANKSEFEDGPGDEEDSEGDYLETVTEDIVRNLVLRRDTEGLRRVLSETRIDYVCEVRYIICSLLSQYRDDHLSGDDFWYLIWCAVYGNFTAYRIPIVESICTGIGINAAEDYLCSDNEIVDSVVAGMLFDHYEIDRIMPFFAVFRDVIPSGTLVKIRSAFKYLNTPKGIRCFFEATGDDLDAQLRFLADRDEEAVLFYGFCKIMALLKKEGKNAVLAIPAFGTYMYGLLHSCDEGWHHGSAIIFGSLKKHVFGLDCISDEAEKDIFLCDYFHEMQDEFSYLAFHDYLVTFFGEYDSTYSSIDHASEDSLSGLLGGLVNETYLELGQFIPQRIEAKDVANAIDILTHSDCDDSRGAFLLMSAANLLNAACDSEKFKHLLANNRIKYSVSDFFSWYINEPGHFKHVRCYYDVAEHMFYAEIFGVVFSFKNIPGEATFMDYAVSKRNNVIRFDGIRLKRIAPWLLSIALHLAKKESLSEGQVSDIIRHVRERQTRFSIRGKSLSD